MSEEDIHLTEQEYEESLLKLNDLDDNGEVSKKKTYANALEPDAVQSRDVLNSIFQPRYVTLENGEEKEVLVSTTPSKRNDVLDLQKKLDNLLLKRKAKETGICPVRSDIYSQCFDEIIRQVTIDCSARGLLLVRVRDEMKTTIDAYNSLYESAINWGMRKATAVEEGKNEVLKENTELLQHKAELEAKVAQLHAKIEALEKAEEDYRIQKEKEHEDGTSFLKRQTNQLKGQLEQMLSSN